MRHRSYTWLRARLLVVFRCPASPVPFHIRLMAYSRSSLHQSSSSLYPWADVNANVSFDSYLQLDPYAPAAAAPALVNAPSRPSSSSAHPSYAVQHDRHPRLASASWEPDLYRFDDLAASSSPLSQATLSPSPAPAPNVKEEDTQDDFVLETPLAYDVNHASSVVFNAMTEVPLRATGASKEMRKLMGVFRLDPFTAHGTVRNPDPNIAWNGEPIGPLREKPHLIEFQIDIPGAVKRESTPREVDEHLPAESSYGTPDMRRGATPYLTGHSPCPSLGYPYDDSSSIDSHPQLSSHASSKWSPVPLTYSPQLVEPSDAPYTVLTPAQAHAMDQQTSWGIKYPSAGGHQHIGASSSGDNLYSSGSHVSRAFCSSIKDLVPNNQLSQFEQLPRILFSHHRTWVLCPPRRPHRQLRPFPRKRRRCNSTRCGLPLLRQCRRLRARIPRPTPPLHPHIRTPSRRGWRTGRHLPFVFRRQCHLVMPCTTAWPQTLTCHRTGRSAMRDSATTAMAACGCERTRRSLVHTTGWEPRFPARTRNSDSEHETTAVRSQRTSHLA